MLGAHSRTIAAVFLIQLGLVALLAVVAGLISGFSNASLLAMINHSLTLPQTERWLGPGVQFALLALLTACDGSGSPFASVPAASLA